MISTRYIRGGLQFASTLEAPAFYESNARYKKQVRTYARPSNRL